MNINFINNTGSEKNPTIIVVSNSLDLKNVNKFPLIFKDILLNLKKVSNLSQILEKNNFVNLVIPVNNSAKQIIIFKTSKYNHYKSLSEGALIYKKIVENKYNSINLCFSRNILNKKSNYVNDILTVILIRSFNLDKYFTNIDKKEKKIEINVFKDNKYRTKYNYNENLVNSINETKDLISEHANILYPESYAIRCLKLKKYGINVKILDKNQIEKIGMKAI